MKALITCHLASAINEKRLLWYKTRTCSKNISPWPIKDPNNINTRRPFRTWGFSLVVKVCMDINYIGSVEASSYR